MDSLFLYMFTICFDTMVSNVSLGVLSLPGRVRSYPTKSSGTLVALTGTLIIIQPSMTCPFLPRSLRCYTSNLFCGTILWERYILILVTNQNKMHASRCA